MSHVLIDLDDVVACHRHRLKEALELELAREIDINDWHAFDLCQIYPGLTVKRLYEIFHEYETVFTCEPERGAFAALWALKQAGCTIHLITKRGWHPQAWDRSYQWLVENGLVFHTLTVVPHGKKKSDVYPEGAPYFDALVDDHAENLEDALRSGQVARFLLVDRPWNQSMDHRLFERVPCIGSAVARLLA